MQHGRVVKSRCRVASSRQPIIVVRPSYHVIAPSCCRRCAAVASRHCVVAFLLRRVVVPHRHAVVVVQPSHCVIASLRCCAASSRCIVAPHRFVVVVVQPSHHRVVAPSSSRPVVTSSRRIVVLSPIAPLFLVGCCVFGCHAVAVCVVALRHRVASTVVAPLSRRHFWLVVVLLLLLSLFLLTWGD
jgi:hypothetical protein